MYFFNADNEQITRGKRRKRIQQKALCNLVKSKFDNKLSLVLAHLIDEAIFPFIKNFHL